MTPKITINEFPVLSSRTVSWSLRSGVQPVMESFDVRPEDAKQLLSVIKSPVTLKIEGDGNRNQTIKNLWVVSEAPANDPFLRTIVLSDRRWFWPYALVVKRYNMRRAIGHKRAPSPIAELGQVVPEVQFIKWTMKNPSGAAPESLWKATEIIEDVLLSVFKSEQDFWGGSPEIIYERGMELHNRTLSLENIEIDDNGDSAINRALSYIPESSIYLDTNGDVFVYSKTSGLESAEVDRAGPEFVGSGQIKLIANDITLPKKIRVWFTREVEVRHDFNEVAEGGSVTRLEDGDPENPSREMANVLPVPDFTLTSNGISYPQGAWIWIEDALTAWGTPPGIGGTRLGHDLIQKMMVPFMDIASAMQLTGARDVDNDWASRINAIEANYRRRFRINKLWVDRTLSIRDYRVSTVDVQSGARGKAEYYSDYAKLYSTRSIFKNRAAGHPSQYAVNITGYPSSGNIDSTTKPVPAEVSVDDEEQGILSVSFLSDPARVYHQFLPSKIENMPGGDLDTLNVSFTDLVDGETIPKLESAHKSFVILTEVPLAPNNLQQLHAVEVNVSDVTDTLPRLTNQKGLGPTMNVRVRAGLVTAKFRWDDSRSEDIERMFGSNGGIQDDAIGFASDLLINGDPVIGNKEASINEIAKAVATSIWATYINRREGVATYDFKPEIRPAGWLDEVTWEVDNRGIMSTRLNLPEQIKQIDFVSFLSSSARAILFREVQAK